MISVSESEPYMSSASKDSVSDESSSTGSENNLDGSRKRLTCEVDGWICLMECKVCVSECPLFWDVDDDMLCVVQYTPPLRFSGLINDLTHVQNQL